MPAILSHFQCVEEISIATANGFVDYLRPAHPSWGSKGTSQWYFRGQADASWPLTPRAWRVRPPSGLETLTAEFRIYLTGAAIDAIRYSKYLGITTPDQPAFYDLLAHLAAEHDSVRHFAILADELGMDLPDADKLISGLDFLGNLFLTNSWPQFELKQAFGIAQHHGIPTRLLDWTRRPLIGAYFASTLGEGASPSEIGVWAISVPFIRSTSTDGIRVLTSQRAQDAFLQKQEGLFIWHEGANEYYWRKKRWPTLIESIEEIYLASSPTPATKPIKLLKLPGTEVDALKQLLWHERISLAHLMPTFDNIARTALASWAQYKGLRTEVDAYGA